MREAFGQVPQASAWEKVIAVDRLRGIDQHNGISRVEPAVLKPIIQQHSVGGILRFQLRQALQAVFGDGHGHFREAPAQFERLIPKVSRHATALHPAVFLSWCAQ